MKAKKLLSLVSLFAGAAIVGATFAAWAVTDNADPFGIKISPGSIAEDTTGSVTLSYGQRTYANVEGLETGKDRLAATVNLIADTSTGASYTGKFRISLINQTEKQNGLPLLIEHLSVDVYDVTIQANNAGEVTTDRTSLTPIGHIPTQASAYVEDISVTVTDNVAKPVYVVVGLEEVSASVLEQIKNDVVYLQMDWNAFGGQDEVQASTVYFRATAGKATYCYAWTDGKVNADYPGKAMTELQEGYYSYELSYDYEDLLFVQIDNEQELNKTADLQITNAIRTQTPCYDKTLQTPAWVAAPTFENLNKDYYLVGTFNGWQARNAYGLTVDAQDANHYRIEGVTVEAGAEMKIRSADGANWYDNGSGNFVINDAGVYDFDFYVNADNGIHIVCAQHQGA